MVKDLPQKIREQRRKLGYSQRELARQLDVSPSVVSGYETGERTPSVEVLLSLAGLFRCSTDYLLGKERAKSITVLDAEGLSPQQLQLVVALINELRQ